MKKENKYILAIFLGAIFIAIMWFYGNMRIYHFLPSDVLDRTTGVLFICLLVVGIVISLFTFKKE